MQKNRIQRTLILFKPDAVQRGIVGEILTRFERVGLKIIATKMIFPNKEHYYKHYESIGKMVSRRGEKAFDMVLDFMTQGPGDIQVVVHLLLNRFVLGLNEVVDPARDVIQIGRDQLIHFALGQAVVLPALPYGQR